VSHEWRIFDWHLAHHGAEVAHRSEVSSAISETQSKLYPDYSIEEQAKPLIFNPYHPLAAKQSAPIGAMIDTRWMAIDASRSARRGTEVTHLLHSKS
jgi:hypothetical protein